jgi:hypothetical protein
MNDSYCSQLNFHFASEDEAHLAESPPLIIRTCGHVLDNGRVCRAAAVRGRRHCRAHGLQRLRQRRMARARRKLAVVRLPRLMDPEAVEAAHTVVRVASAGGRMDPACARLAHRVLRQAASAMRFIEWQRRQMSALGSPPGRDFLPPSLQGPEV